MLAKSSWEAAEAYRLKTAYKEATPVRKTTPTFETPKEEPKQDKEVQNSQNKPTLTREVIIQALKEKGIKGAHLIKSDDTLIKKAQEAGIIQ